MSDSIGIVILREGPDGAEAHYIPITHNLKDPIPPFLNKYTVRHHIPSQLLLFFSFSLLIQNIMDF
jgi:hypothetical protein